MRATQLPHSLRYQPARARRAARTGYAFLHGLCAFALLALAACDEPGSDAPLAELAIDQPRLAYFSESYEESRAGFRRLAAEAAAQYRGVELRALPVPNRAGEDLTIDTVYIPAQKQKRGLVIVTSGLHGAEGPAGAAMQRLILREILPAQSLDNTGYLFVHAINAYGVKYFRRVTENNVDLNRNCDTDPALFQNKNAGYAEVSALLNPTGPVDLGALSVRLFTPRAVFNIATKGMKPLRQAVLQGQYENPRGIYFGGQAFEVHQNLCVSLFQEKSTQYQAVMLLDFHTGFGERGRLHLFPDEAQGPTRQAIEDVFTDHSVDWPSKEDFYSVTGSFGECVGRRLPPGKLFVPMVLEFGTLDSQTTGGSIESIRRVILENQGVQYGFAAPEDEAETKRLYREMFYPSSPKWRTKITNETTALLRMALPNFGKLTAGEQPATR